MIDDSELIHRSVAGLLRRGGLTLRHAYRGGDGIAEVHRQPPSLILLDIDLQDEMDGFDVCRALQADERTREIPIIFLTGSEDPDTTVRAFEEGASDYIIKPFKAAELRARVNAALRAQELVHALSEANAALESDLARRELLQRRLEESEERYALVIKASNDGLWDWDLLRNRIYYAPRWSEMLGCEAEALGDDPDAWYGRIVSGDLAAFQAALDEHLAGDAGQFDHEMRMQHADGGTRWMRCRAVIVREDDGTAVRLVGALADVTASREAQEALRSAALHDRLTGLPNRDLFTNRVQHALQRSRRSSDYRFAVLFFDFDRFKVVNDSLGHEAGDALLVSISERLRRELREVDTAARFGGDEFVVLLDGIGGVEDARFVCDRLIDAFSMPHLVDGNEVVSTASVGLVCSDLGYERAEEMIRDADAAMYQAKQAGKAQYKVFDDRLHEEAMRRLELESDLRTADADEELRVAYQPIVSLESGLPVGFEALVRWQHPTLGLVPPDHFIPIAEETGFIVELGRHVLEVACRQLRAWNDRIAGGPPLTMNVNLSKRQLIHPDAIDMIRRIMAATGTGPGELKLEITETTIVDDRADLTPRLTELRDLGVPLAMDDFGTGQSSLSCLHRFPIDVLKIDRSFIRNMQDNRDFAAVIHAVVTLAQHLGMTVVAEGLETPDQVALLQAQDCDFGQGFHFARPLWAADAERYLLEHGRLRARAA